MGWILTKDFGLGKRRKQLRLATYILVELPEILMKLPEITVSLPHRYLQKEGEREMDEDRKDVGLKEENQKNYINILYQTFFVRVP